MVAAPRLPAAALAVLVLSVLVVAAGCGGGDDPAPGPAATLAAPGTEWATMSEDDRVEALQACRLDAAVAAATSDGVQASPYYAARYSTIATLDGTEARMALDVWFATPAHAKERIGNGCATVLRRLVDLGPVTAGPLADFGYPVASRSSELYLAVSGPGARLPVRLTPSDAQISVDPAPGRAASPARARLERHGASTTLALRDVPLGVSYLQVRVSAGARSWTRLLVVRRTDDVIRRASTFATITLRGKGSRGLRVLDLPRAGRATVQTDGASLVLSSRGALVLAHAPTGRGATTIPAGRYRDLHVTTSGPWTVRIVPAADSA